LMPGGELMGLNVIDDYSFEFTFSIPYYRAVEVFAGGEYYAASHALMKYMPAHNEEAEALAEEEGYESWQQAFQFHAGTSDDYYDRDTTMPTLNPWIISEIGADSVLWTRNPYYWRVDTAGNQLPYMDEVLVIMTENVNATAPVKSLAGELDINDFGLGIDDFPVYKKGEEAGDYKVHLWPRLDQSHAMGFAFNYTYAPDEVLRELFNDLRFRQAMSLAINREEIAENVFLGLVEPYTAPVSPAWPGYEDWMGNYYGEYDVEQANALLDEMGLEWDENGEWRLRPDGETLTVPGEWATEWLAYTEDLLDLVTIHWAEIGVKFEHKFVPEDTLQTMHVANENAVGISNSDGGAEQLARGAYPIRLMPPWHWGSTGCCPMSAYLWRVWLDTEGADGIEPPDDIKRIYELVQQWLETPHGTDEYISLINEVITLNVENLYYFGTVSSPPRVWIIHNRMGNVPAEDGQLGAWGARPYLHETYYIKQ
ncbi:MAG: ABC transporter substrate-binding protein, partial [Chloroflexota bacterium]